MRTDAAPAPPGGAGEGGEAGARTRRARRFWISFATLLAADLVTKQLAVAYLSPSHVPHRVIGDVLQFTLAYNTGAAMGMSLGQYSRWGFTILAIGILFVLRRLYLETPPEARWQTIALGLITAGAVGNLIDRIRSERGVVDFIDVGIGAHRFWTFNVADMGVTCGAIFLAISLSRTPSPDVPATK